MKTRVLQLLQELIHIDSESQTAKERDVELFLFGLLQAMNSVTAEAVPVPGDIYERAVVYGYVRGKTEQTVIFLNHHDVVGTEAYGKLAHAAFSPEVLLAKLAAQETDKEVLADLQSGEWLVGRGSCDMKGGMAAQLAVMEAYGAHPGKASLLFLSVPDEESYSAGMRAAVSVLQELQKQEGFRYVLAVNCEPSPKEHGRLVAYTGSVGKLLPVVVVQGKAVHIENYGEGVNPVGILARIVAMTEGCEDWTDAAGDERTPPPAWMYMRDRKDRYDVSLPHYAAGWLNVLTYEKTPSDVMELLKKAAMQVVQDAAVKPEVRIMTGAELLAHGKQTAGFDVFFRQLYQTSAEAICRGTSSYAETTINMVVQMLTFLHMTEPVIVIAFAPPFYPSAQSRSAADASYEIFLRAAAVVVPVTYKPYFNGISDCSYCCVDPHITEDMLQGNLLLQGSAYPLDIQAMIQLPVPFLLLGPWGKDLHERTERVHIGSVSQDLPQILEQLLACAGNMN